MNEWTLPGSEDSRARLWNRWGGEKSEQVPQSVLGLLMNAARCYCADRALSVDPAGFHAVKEALAYTQERIDARQVLEALGQKEVARARDEER